MVGWPCVRRGCYGINGTRGGKKGEAGVTLETPDQILKCDIFLMSKCDIFRCKNVTFLTSCQNLFFLEKRISPAFQNKTIDCEVSTGITWMNQQSMRIHLWLKNHQIKNIKNCLLSCVFVSRSVTGIAYSSRLILDKTLNQRFNLDAPINHPPLPLTHFLLSTT